MGVEIILIFRLEELPTHGLKATEIVMIVVQIQQE